MRLAQRPSSFRRTPASSSFTCFVAALAGLAGGTASAACAPTATPGTGQSVVCDGATTGSASVIAAPGSTGVAITVDNGATLTTNATQALLVRDASTITNNGTITVSGGSGSARAAMVATGNDNAMTNNGAIRTTSGGTSGILVTSNSSTRTLITNNGTIATTGGSSHGISSLGPGNTLVNNGSITAGGTSAKGVYMQGGNVVTNLLVNTGSIATTGANSPSGGADAVHANTLGGTFFSRVENRAGGSFSSVNGYGYRGQNGNDTLVNAGAIEGHGGADNTDAIYMGALGNGTLILQTGSVIRGGADGGVGKTANTFLEGRGTVDNAFRNFQNLTMRGTEWSWLTDASFSQSIRIESGRFNLPATLTSPVIGVLPGTTVAGTGTFVGNVTNQGTLLPGPNDGVNFGAFTVRGNYLGNGALMQINTVLAGDNAPSDRLVIDGGAASGGTAIRVVNRGGMGAPTLADGILVVQAVNGGTTAAQAFSLAQPVEAGAYTYRLFRGGAAGNSPDNWYLRNSGYLVGGVVVGSVTEALEVAAETPGVPGSPAPVVEQVKLYRPEVALYSSVPLVVRQLGLAQLGSFHDRQGDQQLLASDEGRQASWGRVFGESTRQRLRGDANPQFDGNIHGLQLGHDFLVGTDASGGRHRVGLLGGYTRASGDTSGMAGGATNAATGRLRVEGYSLGAYWTRVAASGWYSDAVLMATRFKTEAQSTLGRGGRPHGKTLTASLEAGYPIALGDSVSLQPQVQLIWQRSSIDDFDDGLSTVRFQRDNAVTGRLGARLEGSFSAAGGTWKPYLKANLWRTFSGTNVLFFGPTDQVGNRRTASALEVGAGVVGQVNRTAAVYGGLAYTRAIGNEGEQSGMQGQVGVRLRW